MPDEVHLIKRWVLMRRKKVSENEIRNLMQKYYGFDDFKGPQLQIISDILSGNDVLAVLGTGAGKSLCYQLPAIYLAAKGKTTIVIEPVLALMNNQCDELNYYLNKGGASFKAITINSQTSDGELGDFRREQDVYRIIYVSPEKFTNPKFGEMIKENDIGMIVVDEAHCTSLWGHDFRIAYSKIGTVIRKRYRSRPIVSAFTATATGHVIGDIVRLLDLRIDTGDQKQIYKDRIIRDNLNLITYERWYLINRYCRDLVKKRLDYYQKSHTEELNSKQIKALLDDYSDPAKRRFIKKYILTKQDALGIIYCNTKYEVKQLCKYLSRKSVNIDCAAYYGVSDIADPEDIENSEIIRQQNAETMNRFYNDEKLSCVVATTAFGMGIDKSRGRDVTYIINYGIPRSVESFYQEIGRAGRHSDLVCDCILLYDTNDAEGLKSWLKYNPDYTQDSSEYKVAVDRIKKMKEYAQLTSLEERNSFIEDYFGSYTPPRDVDMTKPTKYIYLNRSKLGWYLIKPENISISNNKMPDLFDIMVLDAVNAHIINDGSDLTYLEILRTLSGKDYFDPKSPLNKAVEESLEKLKNMTIHYDNGEIQLISFEIKPRRRGQIIDNINETVPSAYFDERAIYYKMPAAYLGLPVKIKKKTNEEKEGNEEKAGEDLSSIPQTKEGLMIKYYILSKITYARYLYMSYVKDDRYDGGRRLIRSNINLSNMLHELGVCFPNTPKGDMAKKKRLFIYIRDYLESLKDKEYIADFVFDKTKRCARNTLFLYEKDENNDLHEYNTVRIGFKNRY